MSELNRNPLSGNQWVDRLLELESAKKEALLVLDADNYEQSTREQVRLVSLGVPDFTAVPRDQALALAEKIRLNSALLLNLVSISPHFAIANQEYTSDGELSGLRCDRVKVEA